jgi:WD40 repeat protein
MGTQNPPQFKFIAKRDPAAGEYIEDEAISPDGKVVAFGHSASTFKAMLYNAETDELYDPLSGIANVQWSNFMGFSQNGKIVLEYEVNPSVNNNFVVHDPATKTNTQLGQAGYEDFWRRMFTPDCKYFMINAKKIIEQAGVNFEYSNATPDSSHIFLQGRDSTSSNLFMYDVQADALTKLTNHDDLNVNWFSIRAFSKDKSKMYFEERFNNGTKQVKEYTFATGAIRLISY